MLDLLFPKRPTEQLVADKSTDALCRLVAPTKKSCGAFECVALLPYREPLVGAYIQEAKFHNNQTAQKALSRLLADYLFTFVEESDAYSQTLYSLVPVPLSKNRQKTRGYNQVEQICSLALVALKKTGSPSMVLERVRDTAPQTALPKDERIKNMQGAFAARDVDGSRSYIVVDDVLTTGATMQAACEALQNAGASRVIGVALAH